VRLVLRRPEAGEHGVRRRPRGWGPARLGAAIELACLGRAAFRFAEGERVRVLGHPAQPLGEVTARWSGAEVHDPYGENIYAISGFVTRQRESNLARGGFMPLPLDTLDDWRMAGMGRFHSAGPSTVNVQDGPGILWYPRTEFGDFMLLVDWRLSSADDNSGIFLRIPSLDEHSANDWQSAALEGLEVQIDDRGVDPERRATGSARHRTGAIYGRAPALAEASRPAGEWNMFEIEAQGPSIRVRLNGVTVSRLHDALRARGYIGLQAHHLGSRVQFRALQIRPL
jgi:hypothetical protein